MKLKLFNKKTKEKPFDKWLRENWEKDNILPPELDAQDAINFLCDELLGENWYLSISMSQKQANTVIVDNIITAYAHGLNWRRHIK